MWTSSGSRWTLPMETGVRYASTSFISWSIPLVTRSSTIASRVRIALMSSPPLGLRADRGLVEQVHGGEGSGSAWRQRATVGGRSRAGLGDTAIDAGGHEVADG